MTVQASRIDLQCKWRLARREIIRRHITRLALRVPVDGRFEPITLPLEKISSATLAGAQEIAKLKPPVELASRRRSFAFVAQPDLVALRKDFVMHARSRVLKVGGNKAIRSETAGVGHRCLAVTVVDCAMAGRTSCIGVASCVVLSGVNWNSRRQRDLYYNPGNDNRA